LIRLEQGSEIDSVFVDVVHGLDAREIRAEKFLASVGSIGSYQVEVLGQQMEVDSPLTGAHQQRNVALALAASEELARRPEFSSVTTDAIARGVKLTRWPGRMERFQAQGREWLLDVAHNPAGARALAAGLSTAMRYTKSKILVFSCLRDKPLRELAEILFPLFDHILLTPIHSPRATSLSELGEMAQSVGSSWELTSSVAEAIEKALKAEQEMIVVSGSVYLVGEVRKLLEEKER
jgi:dihydrofolate synthase/folylpolyglutamate synthase